MGTIRILGIDPGFGRMGYGVIEKKNNEWVHVSHDCLETDSKMLFVDRLKELHIGIKKIIKEFSPTHASVEELFFAKNVKTALQVGQARGVILLTLVQAGLPIVEFTPLQIKQALTGYGRADKTQVQFMVGKSLKLTGKGLQDDAADALAAALTAGFSMGFEERLNKARGQVSA